MARLRAANADTLAGQIAREIRAEMGRQGISQGQLADQLGCTQRSLSRRLTGDVPVDVAELEQLADALGVPLSQFLPTPARAA